MDDYLIVRRIFHTQIEVIHSLAMEKVGESYDTYNKREMEAISMRITTQMLNESARKAGLPINNTSLLNYIKNDGTGNTLLDALNKKKKTAATTAQKSNYEKIDKEADQLTQSAQALLQNDENSLFEQAKASGDYTVDAATKAQAQKDISEDGYWGVKQTSHRLFDFACALAGDDVDKMKEMQAAVEKGFKQATGAWGRELPSICKDTFDATNKLFDDYYASKEEQTEIQQRLKEKLIVMLMRL